MSLDASEMSVEHWIAGNATPPASNEYFDVLNPLNDSVIGQAPRGNAADIDHAVQVAASTFSSYRKTLPKQREEWLLNAAVLLGRRAELFSQLLIDEVGSAISKARREVDTAIATLRAAAGTVRRLSGQTMPTDVAGRLSYSVREPLGVVAGISPFNVPLIKAVKQSAMPLATGNTCVLLPSPEAPATVAHLARLYKDAGIPDGAFNVVFGYGEEIGDHLTTHADVRFVSFTGSTKVGRHIQSVCGLHGKRVSLEMGGKNPLIVLQDADVQLAVKSAVIGGFLFQGQICMASSRIYVHDAVYDPFVNALCSAVKTLTVRDLSSPDALIGPIINQRQRTRIRRHIEDAGAQGATIETGGEWKGNVLMPTVLTGVSEECEIHRQETFGPVVAVYRVHSADEALAGANDSPLGLCAAVHTQDLTRAMKFVRELNVGMVHVNAPTIQEEAHVPFGGNGDSGFGREGSEVAIDDLTEWKWVTMQSVPGGV